MRERGEVPVLDPVVRLHVGATFPRVAAARVGGGEIVLPDDVRDDWAVLLFYRGHWCPYCRSQLQDFQRNLDRFSSARIRVVASSADTRDDAQHTVETHGIEFPVAYGLDPVAIQEMLGSYVGGDPSFIQATGFVLAPEGRVVLAVYSSGAVGRLVSGDVLGLVEYARSHE